MAVNVKLMMTVNTYWHSHKKYTIIRWSQTKPVSTIFMTIRHSIADMMQVKSLAPFVYINPQRSFVAMKN